MRVGSLFSGIGGIDLGLERAGFQVIWQSEIDPYASKVLAKRWPGVPNLGDVTQIDWSSVERPDVICGGFPCQPVSVAGRRLVQRDERWLWPEFARCVRLLRPRYVVVENVPGILIRGMGDVLGDLADLGYDAEWAGIPAAAVGAPHIRWRILVVAYTDGPGLSERRGPITVRTEQPAVERCREGVDDPLRPGSAHLSESQAGCGINGRRSGTHPAARDRRGALFARGCPSDSGWWTTEPDVGRVAHGIPSRVDRLRCLGNAVVPQVAEYVGRQLLAAAS